MAQNTVKLSLQFKIQTFLAVMAIAIFILTYVTILGCAVLLTYLCVYYAIQLVLAKPIFLTIVLGLGMTGLGFVVSFFLVKFLFSTKKVDRSHLIEITKADEPELFELINDIVKKVNTSFPKKVYLSSDVNAAVFYDSSFWSMFLPVRKNLQIGLGLVNSVTKSELKAILAHEFGHFSQKTMKVGSYVYNVNHIIFELVNENDTFQQKVQEMADVSSYFTIFIMLAEYIIQFIKWILKKLYVVINKSYLGLSREMEFHADEIAASVTGYEPLKESLLRLNLAEHSYNSILSYYEGEIENNFVSKNIYKEQFFVLNFLGINNNLQIINNLPSISIDEMNRYVDSKIVIKDQWSSHPSTIDRIERLEKTGFKISLLDNDPANNFFKKIEKYQEEFTRKMFSGIEYKGAITKLNLEEFSASFTESYINNTFSKIFNNYYDNNNPIPFDLQLLDRTNEILSFEELYSDQKVELTNKRKALENDQNILQNIYDKVFEINSFDYDGKKYKNKDSKNLLNELKEEHDAINKQIEANDQAIFRYFKNLEKSTSNVNQLENLYKTFFEYDKEFNKKYEIFTKLSQDLEFINYNTPNEKIMDNFKAIRELEEDLKLEIREIFRNKLFEDELTKEIKSTFEFYLKENLEYFGTRVYYDDNLSILFKSMNYFVHLLSRGYFLHKKNILLYQEELELQKRNSVTNK